MSATGMARHGQDHGQDQDHDHDHEHERKGTMTSKSAALLPLWALALPLVLPSVAWADGLVLRADELGADRAAIELRVRTERARNPAPFDSVAGIDVARVARSSRSRRPAAIGVMLRRMGPEARWALADLAALHRPAWVTPQSARDVKANLALQVALLDAIGVAADPALGPLLRAAFERSPDAAVQSVAAVGLGKLGAAGLPALLAHAVPGDARYLAAVRGLGASRQGAAVDALGQLLDRTSDEDEAREIAGALAEAGSSWAWATGKAGTAAEGEAVRRAAAAALSRNTARLPRSVTSDLEAALRRMQ